MCLLLCYLLLSRVRQVFSAHQINHNYARCHIHLILFALAILLFRLLCIFQFLIISCNSYTFSSSSFIRTPFLPVYYGLLVANGEIRYKKHCESTPEYMRQQNMFDISSIFVFKHISNQFFHSIVQVLDFIEINIVSCCSLHPCLSL